MQNRKRVSIPLEQGSVLRHKALSMLYQIKVSIPLEQGSVLRQETIARMVRAEEVSIPLEQGSVLRRTTPTCHQSSTESQSLWNRAVSYDCRSVRSTTPTRSVSIPLEQGSVLRPSYQRQNFKA